MKSSLRLAAIFGLALVLYELEYLSSATRTPPSAADAFILAGVAGALVFGLEGLLAIRKRRETKRE